MALFDLTSQQYNMRQNELLTSGDCSQQKRSERRVHIHPDIFETKSYSWIEPETKEQQPDTLEEDIDKLVKILMSVCTPYIENCPYNFF